MKKIIRTASLVTSGIIVGALVRKYAFQGSDTKQTDSDPVKSVKNIFNRNSTSENLDNYFV